MRLCLPRLPFRGEWKAARFRCRARPSLRSRRGGSLGGCEVVNDLPGAVHLFLVNDQVIALFYRRLLYLGITRRYRIGSFHITEIPTLAGLGAGGAEVQLEIGISEGFLKAATHGFFAVNGGRVRDHHG